LFFSKFNIIKTLHGFTFSQLVCFKASILPRGRFLKLII